MTCPADCPERHCEGRPGCWAHVADTEHVCGACIGRTRNDIAMIVTLAALMPGEAVVKGVNSEAAYLAGPAADPGGWTARKVWTKKQIERSLEA